MDHVEGEETGLSGGERYGCPMAKFTFNVRLRRVSNLLPSVSSRKAGRGLFTFSPPKNLTSGERHPQEGVVVISRG